MQPCPPAASWSNQLGVTSVKSATARVRCPSRATSPGRTSGERRWAPPGATRTAPPLAEQPLGPAPIPAGIRESRVNVRAGQETDNRPPQAGLAYPYPHSTDGQRRGTSLAFLLYRAVSLPRPHAGRTTSLIRSPQASPGRATTPMKGCTEHSTPTVLGLAGERRDPRCGGRGGHGRVRHGRGAGEGSYGRRFTSGLRPHPTRATTYPTVHRRSPCWTAPAGAARGPAALDVLDHVPAPMYIRVSCSAWNSPSTPSTGSSTGCCDRRMRPR